MDIQLHTVDTDCVSDVVTAAFDERGKFTDGHDELVYAAFPDVYMLRSSWGSPAVLGRIVIDGNNSSAQSLKEDKRGNEPEAHTL